MKAAYTHTRTHTHIHTHIQQTAHTHWHACAFSHTQARKKVTSVPFLLGNTHVLCNRKTNRTLSGTSGVMTVFKTTITYFPTPPLDDFLPTMTKQQGFLAEIKKKNEKQLCNYKINPCQTEKPQGMSAHIFFFMKATETALLDCRCTCPVFAVMPMLMPVHVLEFPSSLRPLSAKLAGT